MRNKNKIPPEFKNDIREFEAIRFALKNVPDEAGIYFIQLGFRNINIKRKSWQKLFRRFQDPEKAYYYLKKFF